MLLIPATIQITHAFEHHDHDIVSSLDHQDQVHSDYEECTICDFVLNSAGFLQNASAETLSVFETFTPLYPYHFLEGTDVISPSLRGPPSA